MVRILILFVALEAFACGGNGILSEQGLRDYVMEPENGLRKHCEKNGIDVEVIYRPTELILAQQLQGLTDQQERIRTIRNFDSLSYFVVKFSRNGKEVENRYARDPEEFLRVTNYLSSGIAKDICLILSTDTLFALDAVYARMYGAATATSVMAVFDADLKEKSGIITFCLDDTELGIGRNSFDFDLSDIKKAPTLNLN